MRNMVSCPRAIRPRSSRAAKKRDPRRVMSFPLKPRIVPLAHS